MATEELTPAALMRQTTAMQNVQLQSTTRPRFNFEPFLQHEYNLGLYPDRPTCEYWIHSTSNQPYGSHTKGEIGQCPLGADCPLKHPSKIFKNKIVCKYWLRGLCKMGPNCDFLHEYNLSKMPECAYYSQTGVCSQSPECIYLHVDAGVKIAECDDYKELGFCPDGPNCNKRHIRRRLCERYLTGFCPEGGACEFAHPKFSVVRSQMGRFCIESDENIIKRRLERLGLGKAKEEVPTGKD